MRQLRNCDWCALYKICTWIAGEFLCNKCYQKKREGKAREE